MKDNLISIRAQSFLDKKEFLKSNIPQGFEVVFDENDKILTVFHSQNFDGTGLVFADVLSRFAKNKKFSDLFLLNFREAENFLRDENHLPSFNIEEEEALESFQKTKIILIAMAAKSLLKNDLKIILEEKSQWESLNLVAKNLWAQKLIRPLGWRLVLCESTLLTLTGVPADFTGEGKSSELSLLFNHILEGAGKDLPMKVVAV